MTVSTSCDFGGSVRPASSVYARSADFDPSPNGANTDRLIDRVNDLVPDPGVVGFECPGDERLGSRFVEVTIAVLKPRSNPVVDVLAGNVTAVVRQHRSRRKTDVSQPVNADRTHGWVFPIRGITVCKIRSPALPSPNGFTQSVSVCSIWSTLETMVAGS